MMMMWRIRRCLQGLADPFRKDIRAEIENDLFPSPVPDDPVFSPEGLAHGQGRFGDFLEKKMGIIAAVDVPGRDFRLSGYLSRVSGKRGPVVETGANAGQCLL